METSTQTPSTEKKTRTRGKTTYKLGATPLPSVDGLSAQLLTVVTAISANNVNGEIDRAALVKDFEANGKSKNPEKVLSGYLHWLLTFKMLAHGSYSPVAAKPLNVDKAKEIARKNLEKLGIPLSEIEKMLATSKA